MFTNIDLGNTAQRPHVNRFFMTLILRDYGYAFGFRRLLRWLLWAWRRERLAELPHPPSQMTTAPKQESLAAA